MMVDESVVRVAIGVGIFIGYFVCLFLLMFIRQFIGRSKTEKFLIENGHTEEFYEWEAERKAERKMAWNTIFIK